MEKREFNYSVYIHIQDITKKIFAILRMRVSRILSVNKIINKGFSAIFTSTASYINDDKGTRIVTMSQEDLQTGHAKGEDMLCCGSPPQIQNFGTSVSDINMSIKNLRNT